MEKQKRFSAIHKNPHVLIFLSRHFFPASIFREYQKRPTAIYRPNHFWEF